MNIPPLMTTFILKIQNIMTRQSHPKWTVGEEEILLDEIGKNPTNLKQCFLATAEIIGRTPGAISNHYYTKVVKDSQKTAVLTMGRTAVVKNKKRLKENERPIKIRKTAWNFILKMLFGKNRKNG